MNASAVPNTRTTLSLVSALAVCLSAQAFAQESEPVAAPSSTSGVEAAQGIDEVVVRGRRMSEVEFDLQAYVRSFVDEVAALPIGRGFARWHRNVCVGVHNLSTNPAQYLVDRISQLAVEVGLKPGEPGCSPDVMIIFTTNGDETAGFIVDSQPRLLRPGAGRAGMNLDSAALDEFTHTDRAVRWWHVSMPVDARIGTHAVRLPGDQAPPLVNMGGGGGSRVYSASRDDMLYAVIVVDATKLRGTTWQQLGDYLAMVSLAQIDPQAHVGDFDSILNLFDNPRAYSGLTDWDRSYMQALYAINQERVPQIQSNEVVSRMARQEEASANDNGGD
jgi:hypothetical protein